jgi:hypothetical protein
MALGPSRATSKEIKIAKAQNTGKSLKVDDSTVFIEIPSSARLGSPARAEAHARASLPLSAKSRRISLGILQCWIGGDNREKAETSRKR